MEDSIRQPVTAGRETRRHDRAFGRWARQLPTHRRCRRVRVWTSSAPQPELEAVCGGIAALGFLDMAWIVFGVSRRTGADPLRLATVDDAGPEVAGYVATYLLPFLTVAEPDGRDIAAYAIFLAVTGLIYVMNPSAPAARQVMQVCGRYSLYSSQSPLRFDTGLTNGAY